MSEDLVEYVTRQLRRKDLVTVTCTVVATVSSASRVYSIGSTHTITCHCGEHSEWYKDPGLAFCAFDNWTVSKESVAGTVVFEFASSCAQSSKQLSEVRIAGSTASFYYSI